MSITIPYLSVAHIDGRVSDAEEDVLRRGPHERDVFVVEGVPRVQVALVAPNKVMELVDVDETEGWLVGEIISCQNLQVCSICLWIELTGNGDSLSAQFYL